MSQESKEPKIVIEYHTADALVCRVPEARVPQTPEIKRIVAKGISAYGKWHVGMGDAQPRFECRRYQYRKRYQEGDTLIYVYEEQT